MQQAKCTLLRTLLNPYRPNPIKSYPRYRSGHSARISNRQSQAGANIGRLGGWMLALIIALIIPSAVNAASVTLTLNGSSPAPEGYRIYLRGSGQSYNYNSPVWEGSATTCSISQLQDGQTYYMVARAFSGDTESGNSNEVQYTTPASPPEVPANQAPVAKAGADLAVSAGASVILDGSASQDPDGSIASYTWTQTAGQACALSGTGSAQASFTAPGVTSSTTLEFQIKVTDNQGLSAVDKCQVTIVPLAALDSDDDGLSDADETSLYHTDPNNSDSDGDGVNDGDELAAGTDPLVSESEASGDQDKIWLEAEDGDIDTPMQIADDAKASEGGYLWVPQGSGNRLSPSSNSGLAHYTFTVSTSGTYRVWGRIFSPTYGDDSFYVAMDGGAYTRWNTQVDTDWTWDLVSAHAGADPLLFQLSAGSHTLTLMQREDGAKIDRLLITSDTQYLPVGLGEGVDEGVDENAEENVDETTGEIGGDDENIVIEAETGTLTTPMRVQSDNTASSGAYLWVPQGSGNQLSPSSKSGLVQYTFNVSTSGTYRVWGRIFSPTYGDDSFYVAMDGGAYTRWNTQVDTDWTWDLVSAHAGADPLLFQLSAGSHTLTLMQREDGTKIDKLIITRDDSFMP